MEEIFGRQVCGEIANAFVVLRYLLNVALASNSNAILRPLELALEITKILVRFQIGLILRNGDEAA